jgi:hypothetical protein
MQSAEFMTDVEMEIVQYLKQNREVFFNRKEISRRARGRTEFEENPQWAAAPLQSLVAQGIVEQNDSGLYRLSDKYDP